MKAVGAVAPPRPRALRGFEEVPRHWDPTLGSWVAQVMAGCYFVSAAGEIISAVLGSCVATCIRDPVIGYGGMNHFMLPHDAGGGTSDGALRYGSFAVERLVNELIKHGARRERLEAKVFGGGSVIASSAQVGQANVDFVRRYLQVESIALAADDVGGAWARRLRYWPTTGRALVKHLDMSETRAVARAERKQVMAGELAPGAGTVELF